MLDPSDPIVFPSSSSATVFEQTNTAESKLEVMPFIARTCLVCGATAESKHFGCTTCNACAAFFRRSVSQSKRYVCQHGKRCQILKKKSGHLCAFCRFKKCIEVGMLMCSVLKPSKIQPNSQEDSSPLNMLLKAQRATFTNRYAAHLKANAGNGGNIVIGIENPTLPDTNTTVACEFPVFIEYLRMSGFESSGLTRLELIKLAKESLFYPWISFQSVLATLKNNGFKLNTCYFLDENYHKSTDETVMEYVKSCKTFKDFKFAARLTSDCQKENMEAAHKLHALKLDELDLAILFQIFVLRTASKLPEKGAYFNKVLNQLFSKLQEHYAQNYDNVAVRQGNLILATSIIQSASQFFIEYTRMLDLNGYNSYLSTLTNE